MEEVEEADESGAGEIFEDNKGGVLWRGLLFKGLEAIHEEVRVGCSGLDISEANFDFLDVHATGCSSLRRGCMRRCREHCLLTTTGGCLTTATSGDVAGDFAQRSSLLAQVGSMMAGGGFFLEDISSDANVEGDGLKTMRGDRELLEGP